MTKIYKKVLETNFEAALIKAKKTTTPLPPDVKLKLYALYKIATKNQENPTGDKPLINAFKANALFQAKHLSRKKAMEAYIALVNKEIS